jgi:hypothetical protein
MVNGHDIDVSFSQRLEHRLQFVFQHSEVTVHQRVVIRARKRGPSVHPHLFCHLAAARHFRA